MKSFRLFQQYRMTRNLRYSVQQYFCKKREGHDQLVLLVVRSSLTCRTEAEHRLTAGVVGAYWCTTSRVSRICGCRRVVHTLYLSAMFLDLNSNDASVPQQCCSNFAVLYTSIDNMINQQQPVLLLYWCCSAHVPVCTRGRRCTTLTSDPPLCSTTAVS